MVFDKGKSTDVMELEQKYKSKKIERKRKLGKKRNLKKALARLIRQQEDIITLASPE